MEAELTTMDLGPEVKRLFTRLRKAGYSSSFLKASLPDWWEAEIESEPGLIEELKIDLGRRLGLNIPALLAHDVVQPQLPSGVRFKRAANIESETGEPFVAFCAGLARAITASLPEPSAVPSAAEARDKILGRAKWVSLNALLQYCWEHLRIPVISVQASPTEARGFDAVTFKINGRFCIIIAKNVDAHAWLAFILAHELGHIALGHVGDEEVLADRALLGEESSGITNDADEQAANQYALTLLANDVQFVVGEKSGMPDAESALRAGAESRVDPGHLILRYARGSGNWRGAQKTLSQLHKGSRHKAAPEFINAVAQQLLPLGELADDVRDNLVRAMTSA